MQSFKNITRVNFKPPRDVRLPVEVLSIAELRKRATADHFEKLQRADFFRLIGVLEGGTQPMVDFSHHELQAGDWLLVRPGQVFRYDFSQTWSGWLVIFRPDSLIASESGRASDVEGLLRSVDDLASQHTLGPEAHDWMDRMAQQMQRDCDQPGDLALRNALLRLGLASALLRLWGWQHHRAAATGESISVVKRYHRFMRRLELDFAAHHQVQHYARVLGMAEKTLSRACQEACGESAKGVINQRVILEAKRLLAHTTDPVQAIAGDLGFGEATHFTKFFKKQTGMTPLAWRELLRS